MRRWTREIYLVIFLASAVALLAAGCAYTPPPPPPGPGDAPDFSLVGFAALNGGTTGGQGGTIVTVSTGDKLQEYINEAREKGGPWIIYINGTITPANSQGLTKIDIKGKDDSNLIGDISLIGVGNGAGGGYGEFSGIGLKIWRARNIIIRNLKIHHVNIGDKDCISIEGPANNIWVDHCELYNDLDHGKDYYDGLLDAKDASAYLTFSWNYLHHSYKTSLVGSSDSDNHDRKITYHHNWFYNCNSRLPSYRFGTGHVFNNYYSHIIETGINCRMGAKLRIENNCFEDAQNPIGYWDSDTTGYWDVRNNIFTRCTGSVPAASTATVDPPYGYVLDPVDEVKALVTQYAGVGKITL